MPEVRPIDANALKKHMCNMCDDGQRECKGDESCALLVWVNDMPKVEADQVNRAAILRLCNEIEDIVTRIYNSDEEIMYNDLISIRGKLKEIEKELTEDAGND